jgi:hypothetical protein
VPDGAHAAVVSTQIFKIREFLGNVKVKSKLAAPVPAPAEEIVPSSTLVTVLEPVVSEIASLLFSAGFSD